MISKNKKRKNVMKSNLNAIAHITVGKNRTKKGREVFLKDGVEFEIELYNPTQKPVLAKIKINGSYISTSGVVVKPAQRVYLERYIDEPKKFKFETYNVSGSKEEIEHAIKNNGLIEIEFYNEAEKQNFTLITGNGSGMWQSPNSFPPRDNFPWYTTTNFIQCSNTFTSDVTYSDNIKSLNLNETGRVEMGSDSNQSFISVDMQFESYPITTSVYHILPYSSKPITSEEINTSYCTGCGLRRRKTAWSFCPKCGTKF
jgi:hypothetical protein